MLTKEELINISNLLFKGNFGLNAEQTQQVIIPLINKLAEMVGVLDKKEEPKKEVVKE